MNQTCFRLLLLRPRIVVIPLALAVFGGAHSGAATVFSFSLLDHQNLGIWPYGINNSGVVVGYDRSDGDGFLWTPTSYEEIGPPSGETETTFYAINNSGKIAAEGDHFDSSTSIVHTHSYTYNVVAGSYSQPDPEVNQFRGLDDEGHRVGSGFTSSDGVTHGLWDASFFTVAGSTFTTLSGITNSIAGHLYTTGYYRNASNRTVGFVWDTAASGQTDIAALAGAINVYPQAINNHRVVAGYFQDSSSQTHGFIYTPDGAWQTIDYPNGDSTMINGINDGEDIVGTFDAPSSGIISGFMAVVVPPYTLDEAVEALNFVAGLDTFQGVADPRRLDLDGDGYVTLRDVAHIVRKVGGKESNP